MDRNNPVWREYLKAVIRIQIDAGVDGVQLDEAELPLTSLQYGGCFCKDCMKGFREWLGESPGFHYGEFLKAQGFDFKERQDESPRFWEYIRFQRAAIARYFGELADYAREYAASKGRTVLVSGNFFNLFDQYHALAPKVDVIVTEMRNTRYRQPEWYRYVAGFAREKPVVVVENPYGGVVPDLVELLERGRGYDLFRLSLYEAAALGANMSVPYGSWLGSVIEDSFWAPHELCVEIQNFLAEHERLFSWRTASEVAVVYSVESNFRRVARRDQFVDNRSNVSGEEGIPFWDACEALSAAVQPYDVLFFPDGELRADELTPEDLTQYRVLVLPEVTFLTPAQEALLADFPGRIVESAAQALDDPQLVVSPHVDAAVNLQRLPAGVALHVVRYGYDAEADEVPVLAELSLDVRLPEAYRRASAYSPGGRLQASVTLDGERHRLTLRDLPLYGVVLLER
jgi:hypothetical protein